MNLKLLNEERKRKGYTQQFMADKLGFKDRSSYCLIENGKTSVDIELANKISSVFQLSKDRTYEIFFAHRVQDASTNFYDKRMEV